MGDPPSAERRVTEPVRRLRDLLVQGPELVPGLLAVAVMVFWATDQGGFATTSSDAGALFLLGLLVAVAIAFHRSLAALPRSTLVALACFGAFAAWSFLSISWAGVEGDAWDGANRTLLYFICFALFALPRWRPRTAAIVLGTFSGAIAVVGAVTYLRAKGAADPTLFFLDNLFAEPTGYHNADAALFAMAFFPAFFLGARSETPWLLRGPLLGAAVLLLELALLTQSRGAMIVFPIAAVLYLALVPGRVRTIVVALPVAAATALSATAILDVFPAVQHGADVSGALDRAGNAMTLSLVALLAVGWLLGLAEAKLRVPQRTLTIASRGVGAATAIVAVVAIVLAIVAIGNPASWASDRWQDFKRGYPAQGFGDSRLGADLGSNRYDFWRVAVNEFKGAPVEGVGADNFAVDYLQERRSNEEPSNPHSLPIGILAQTGLVGAALFAAFVAAALASAARVRLRGRDALERAIPAVAVVVFAYWFLHSAGDWFIALPALSAPPIAFLALAGRVESTPESTGPTAEPGARPLWRARLAIGAGGLLAAFAALSFALPGIAARDVEVAANSWGADPKGAFDALDQAGSLNFLSAEPDLVSGAIAERRGDHARTRASFTSALDRDPNNWYPLLELGSLDALQGHRGSAFARLRAAARLNPREPLIREALRGVERRRPISLRTIDRQLLARVCSRVGRTNQSLYCKA